MKIYSKEELYDFLNNFDFTKKKETELSSVYFLVKYENIIQPIYFFKYENVWFESPCVLHSWIMKDEELKEYVSELYMEDAREIALQHEQLMQRNDMHYEIDAPQCAPFLPDEIEILWAFSETECLDWLLKNR